MPCRLLLYFPLYFILYTLYFISPALADWNTDFSTPTCNITAKTSATIGESIIITVDTTNTQGVTAILVDNTRIWPAPGDTVPAIKPSVTWNTTGQSTGTPPHHITATIVSPNAAGNTGSCSSINITLNNPPQPPPAPPQCGAYTWNKAYIWSSSGYCWMNWWDNRCTINLYDWVYPWTVTNFYVKAHDNWNNWDWTVCDTRWGSSGLCTRNWSTGYSSQSIAFNNPYYTIGTKYSLIQRTTNWNNQSVETELANTCASGFRYQMPAPNIQYDYTLTNYGTCLTSNATNSVLARIYFPTSNPARQINWVDISEDPNFATFYNKGVPAGATYTDAPIGFNGASGVSGPLTIQPDHTYYVRLFGYDASSNWSTYWFNGNFGWHSAVSIIKLPLCPTDGVWSAWSPWSACPACGDGSDTTTRTRTCTPPSNNGAPCSGPSSQTVTCNIPRCPVDGGWDFPDGPVWNSMCTETCGPGFKTRNCISPVPAYGGLQCLKADGTRGLRETQTCNLRACITPWVQTEGGDVHSNKAIQAPGGP